MKNRPLENNRQVFALAFCSLMAALGAALMLVGGVIPVMTYCSPLIAGVLLIPVLREYGGRWAWLVWLVTALLSLILSADKEAALFYCFLGEYPIAAKRIRQIRPRALAFFCRLLYVVLALGALYGLILFVFRLDIGMDELESLGHYAAAAAFVLLAVTMLLYDRVIRNLEILYERRLRPHLKLPR